MKYYFCDTSALFGIFRQEQCTNEMNNLYWTILNESSDGKASSGIKNVIISSLLPYEIITNLTKKHNDINAFLVEYRSFNTVKITKEILEKSVQLMEKYAKLESFDAMQLACALEAKKNHNELIFASADKYLKEVALAEGFEVYKIKD
jgi:predicted nucleic acid-binding protein